MAASSGVVLTMAATSATAAPQTDATGRPQAGETTISDAARAALTTSPTVVVDPNAVWTIDDIAEGAAVETAPEPEAEEVAETAATSSRDTERTAIAEAEAAPAAAAFSVQALSERGHVNQVLNVRSGPTTDHNRIGSVSPYNTFEITGKANGWYRISYNGGEGWVSGSYTKLGSAPERPAATAPAASSASTASASTGSSSFGNSVVAIARQYIGVPYVYGGATPAGFDCSGFTSYVYAKMGVSIPRSSSAQYGVGRQVSASEAQPGDLIWWPGHVGIYTGNGNHIAARSPGVALKESPIYRSGGVFFRLG